MANAIFNLDGLQTKIQCQKEDKMEEICKNFAKKVQININDLYSLYEGNQINIELTFYEQTNAFDKERNEMNKYNNK